MRVLRDVKVWIHEVMGLMTYLDFPSFAKTFIASFAFDIYLENRSERK